MTPNMYLTSTPINNQTLMAARERKIKNNQKNNSNNNFENFMARYNINNNMFYQTNDPIEQIQISQNFINIILDLINNINIDTEPNNITQLGNILSNKLNAIKQEVKELTKQINELKQNNKQLKETVISQANELAISKSDSTRCTVASNTCSICLTEQANYVCIPCGHLSTCEACTEKISDSLCGHTHAYQGKCPQCRADGRFFQVYCS